MTKHDRIRAAFPQYADCTDAELDYLVRYSHSLLTAVLDHLTSRAKLAA